MYLLIVPPDFSICVCMPTKILTYLYSGYLSSSGKYDTQPLKLSFLTLTHSYTEDPIIISSNIGYLVLVHYIASKCVVYESFLTFDASIPRGTSEVSIYNDIMARIST